MRGSFFSNGHKSNVWFFFSNGHKSNVWFFLITVRS